MRFAERLRVFFYGSYMNAAVLAEVGIAPDEWEVASLAGYDIQIAPRANLVRSPEHVVYGVLTTATHTELARLYDHARDVLGEVYLPEPVLVQTLSGAWRPGLCYIAPAMTERPAEQDYVDRILDPARRFKFPAWYVARLEALRP